MLCVNCGSMKRQDGYQCMDCGKVYCDDCHGTFAQRLNPFALAQHESQRECPKCGSKRKYLYINDRLHKSYDGDKETLFF